MIGEGLRRRQDDEPGGMGMLLLAAAGWALFLVALLYALNARGVARQQAQQFEQYQAHVERQVAVALQETQQMQAALVQCQATRRPSALFSVLQALLGQ